MATAYSYHDWMSSPLDPSSSQELEKKNKKGFLGNLRVLLTKWKTTPRESAQEKKKKKKRGNLLRRTTSQPSITDNYNYFKGNDGITSSFHVSPYEDISPNSVFTDGGIQKDLDLQRKRLGNKEPSPSSDIYELDFEIPESSHSARPSLSNVFDMSGKDNENSIPRGKKISNTTESSSPREQRQVEEDIPSPYEQDSFLLRSKSDPHKKAISPQSSDKSLKSESSDQRHERHRVKHHDKQRGKLIGRSHSFTESTASSERSEGRRSKHSGHRVRGIPRGMEHGQLFMPPYGHPPFISGYGYPPPPPHLVYPPYGYGMPPPPFPGYFNFFPTVPEEAGEQDNMEDQYSQRHEEKRRRRRHKLKEHKMKEKKVYDDDEPNTNNELQLEGDVPEGPPGLNKFLY